MLALYVPKTEYLAEAIACVLIVYAVLIGFARALKLSGPLSAALMLAGAAMALTPDISHLWNVDLGNYGHFTRGETKTDHSDRYFAITQYMHTGRGTLVAYFGMVAAFTTHACVHLARHRIHSNLPQPQQQNSSNDVA